MRTAIIDLGTNTFNLLIVNAEAKQPVQVLLNTKAAVMLGQEGINDGYISDKAFARAYAVLRDFSDLVSQFKCKKLMAFGTSAIRSASNSKAFITKIANDLNICIEPISGEQEAEYIYYGVSHAIPFTNENYLILDIGGGSNELIIANKDGISWKESFNLGGARLLEKFKPSDPITPEQITQVNNYLKKELEPLFLAIKTYGVSKMVGSSGAFDTFADILHYELTGLPLDKTRLNNTISLKQFMRIYQLIIASKRSDRLMIPGMEALRVDTIVMAAIFTRMVLERSGATQIIQSAYSLKEGVARQLVTQ
ncbi:MAG: phosphatase [Bacteroidetes bacterium HGW-Bacteroidetes-4]|jgi:exopolyphosphatase/guanosine-5'-triphosphate,3'-diphosphate pyrophosphatase|nr:MAG: phosphatase [Bacteroidetes bacterium HGW-Bacteroidetes-4]